MRNSPVLPARLPMPVPRRFQWYGSSLNDLYRKRVVFSSSIIPVTSVIGVELIKSSPRAASSNASPHHSFPSAVSSYLLLKSRTGAFSSLLSSFTSSESLPQLSLTGKQQPEGLISVGFCYKSFHFGSESLIVTNTFQSVVFFSDIDEYWSIPIFANLNLITPVPKTESLLSNPGEFSWCAVAIESTAIVVLPGSAEAPQSQSRYLACWK